MSIPEKGSSEWKRNERIINQNPVLKAARDTTEGLSSRGEQYLGAPTPEYKAGYEQIDWSKRSDDKPSFRVRVNGRIVSDPDEPAS